MFNEAIGRRQGKLPRDLEPLGVLVEHRVNDMDERLVSVEEAVPAGQQVALEPALALVLAEHLDHAAIGGEVIVGRHHLTEPLLIGHLEGGGQAVRRGLVGAEDAKVAPLGVQLDHIAEELAQVCGHPQPMTLPGRGTSIA